MISDMDAIEEPGRRNFLGLADAYSASKTSYFHIIPVPYDATSTYLAGSRKGPEAIIDASANLEIYDHNLDLEPARVGIATQGAVPIHADSPSSMVAEVEQAVQSVLMMEKLPVVLGGEHTVSLGAIRALAGKEKFTVVSLDAHADLRDTYQGTPYSHACYLRRASELVGCCALGVRSISAAEVLHVKDVGIRVIFAEDLLEKGINAANLDFIPDDIYISIDVDVLDPSIMPATGTPEPGGLGWYETIGLLERIITGRRVLGFDMVELCPQPGNPSPDFTAAKLLYKVMGLVIKSSRNRREDWIGYGKEKVQEETSCGREETTGTGS